MLDVGGRTFHRYKGKFSMVILLGLLAGLFGGVGISAVIPLFSLMTNQHIEGTGAITSIISKGFLFFHIPFTLPFLAGLIALLFVVKALTQFLARYINSKVSAEYEAEARADLFEKTLDANWPYLLNQRNGIIERILINDVMLSAQVLVVLTNLILLCTSLAMYAIVALNISPLITLLTMAVGGILFFLFKPFYYKTRSIIKDTVATEKEMAHYLNESIQNSKAIKALSAQPQVLEKGVRLFERLRKQRIDVGIYKSAVGPSFEPIGLAFIIILFIFYHRLPGFSIITFFAVVYLVQKIFSFLELSQGNIQRLGEIAPYLQSVVDHRTDIIAHREISAGKEPFRFEDRIEFKGVSFSYEQREPVLSHLDITIRKGQMTGLIGSSGAGKTTIADLLLRLFKPGSGKILVDGKDIQDIDLNAWRNHIGYVSQDLFLINGSVKDNIRFFDPAVSDQDIDDAVSAAHAREFIERMPEGIQTIIGERGVKLSAGQRQRIALARVLARRPEILILDEATSALDNESEATVQKAIDELKGKVTVLAIAHRLSTVTSSDTLMVLDKGTVIESGSPSSLLKDKDSHFFRIYNIK